MNDASDFFGVDVDEAGRLFPCLFKRSGTFAGWSSRAPDPEFSIGASAVGDGLGQVWRFALVKGCHVIAMIVSRESARGVMPVE